MRKYSFWRVAWAKYAETWEEGRPPRTSYFPESFVRMLKMCPGATSIGWSSHGD
jgi:hypothetical protein